ncbi:hypothetical protein HDE_07835 [Halotydeus destructor]|nr:hypothetical protein HDE_07835 [Halotydeus destructor]
MVRVSSPYLLIFTFVQLFDIITSGKIKERFHADVFKFQGRILLTELAVLPTRNRSTNPLARIFYDISTTPVRGLNWTEIYSDSLTTGFYDEQKRYSGFLGQIQRNETDYAFQVVRTDAIVSDSIYVGPAIYSGASHIISKTEMFNYYDDVQLTDVVRNFKTIAWLYLVILCLLINFICISMYLVLSSDKVARQPRPYINTVEALLSPEFRIPPTVFTNYFIYQELINPKNGSQMYHLAELIKENNGFVNAEKAMNDFSQTSKLMFDVIGHIDRGEKTLVIESLFWNLIRFRLLCGLDPAKASEMIVSEPFDEGVLTYFFNKRLPAGVVRYMDYHGRNAAEFSLTAEALKSLADYVISALLNSNFNTLRCFKKLKDNELYDLKFDDATLEPYRSTFQSFLWALCFSTLVLVADQLFHMITGGKIKERFHADVFKFQGRIALTELAFLRTRNWSTNSLARIFYDISTIPIRGLNWTETYTASMTTGFYDEQRRYSGFLGQIQRNETDYAFQVVRTDAIVCDLIYVGPAIYSGASHIISKTEMFNYYDDVQLTDVVRNFKTIAWLYLAILCLLINFICISIYLVLSSDKVAKQPRPYINTVEALLSPEFRIAPTVFTNFFVYQKLRDPENGSQMYHLAELIKEKYGFVDAEHATKDVVQTNKLMIDLIGEIDRGEKTLVIESLFWNLLWFRLFCGLDSVKASEMIVSEPFAEGVLTYFFNKLLPADVIRYMDYHGRNAAEFSLTAEALKSLADYVISALLNSNFDTLRCFKKLKDNELYDLKFDDTTMKPYRSTFQSFIWALGFSTLGLVAGQVSYFYVSSTQRKLFVKPNERDKLRKREPSTLRPSSSPPAETDEQ